MKSPEKWESRRQVPESDPIYQEERERWREVEGDDVFARRPIRYYDMDTRIHEKAVERKKVLEADLAQMTDPTDPKVIEKLKNNIASAEEQAESSLKDRARPLRRDFEKLAYDLTTLMMITGHIFDDRKKYVLSQISAMFSSAEIQPELKNHFGDNLENFTPIDLYDNIRDGSISDELLYAVGKKHLENIAEQEAQLAEIVEETKKEFVQLVTAAVENGELPETALQNLPRIDDVKVVLSDRLRHISGSVMGEAYASGKLRIDNEQLQPDTLPRLKKTMMHEFLHEISGKSVTIKSKTLEHGTYHHFFHRKVGLALEHPDTWYTPNRWLNEAITEWLALELSGYAGDSDPSAYKGSVSYPVEREDLDRLMTQGLEKDLILAAYFENFTEDQPKGEKGKHYAALMKRIDQLEGKGGLSRIEHRHIMSQLEVELAGRSVFDKSKMPPLPAELQPISKVFTITVHVGPTEKNQATKEFVFRAHPKKMGSKTLSVEDQWRPVEGLLSELKNLYKSRFRYSVEVE